MKSTIKRYNSFLNEIDSDDHDSSNFADSLPHLKKVRSGIPWQIVLQWFNDNDIDYQGKSDLDMYIEYIEKNL